MHFQAHGNIDVTIDKFCVIDRPNAAFNKEGIAELHAEILARVKTANLTKWRLIEILSEDAYPTHDAVDDIINAYEHYATLGCTGIHVVCSESQKAVFLKITQQISISIFFYASEPEALEANKAFLN